MRYLLDTHILLWFLDDNNRIKDDLRKILVNPENVIYISVISAWELSIKLKTNPDFKLRTSIRKVFSISGFDILPVTLEDSLAVHKLPLYHKDPFDRLLVAQAKVEKLTLITSDTKIFKYRIPLIKVV